MKNEILCISLPPANPNYPLAGIAAVSSYLKKKGFGVEQLHLNILFDNHSIWTSSTGYSNVNQVLPFLYIYNALIVVDYEKAEKVKEYILSRGIVERPKFDLYIEKIVTFISEIMSNYIERGYKFICFSSKFHQWICAEVCSYFIRKIKKDAIIYIGGQYTSSESENILKICQNIDYSGWGEGEIPLSLLAEHIIKGAKHINDIPRLAYRSNDNIIISRAHNENSYISFSDEHFFDIDDYIIQKETLGEVIIPVERSRKCSWSKCKFCFLTQGYKYREKNAENIINELVYYIEKYEIYKFQFFDNNFVGDDLNEFELLLDNLVTLKTKHPLFHIVFAEIIPRGLTSTHIRKMRAAGMTDVQIGFEALSTKTLHRFKKQQTLADNLFFLKEAIYYGILPSGNNIIINCPDEDRNEIVESIENLIYLRFMFEISNFSIHMPELMIANYSGYMKEIRNADQTGGWNQNKYYPLLPVSIQNRIDRFSIFSFTADTIVNFDLWKQFQLKYETIKEDGYHYKILRKLDRVYFCEYKKETLLVDYPLNSFEIRILTQLNTKCYRISDICNILNVDRNTLFSQTKKLFDFKIVYYSIEDDNVCSIIHFDEPV